MDPLIREAYLTADDYGRIYANGGSYESLQAAFCPSFNTEYKSPNSIDECRASPTDLAPGSVDIESLTRQRWDAYNEHPDKLVRRANKPCMDKGDLIQHIVTQVFEGKDPEDPLDRNPICRVPQQTLEEALASFAQHAEDSHDLSFWVITEQIRLQKNQRLWQYLTVIFKGECETLQQSCQGTTTWIDTYNRAQENPAHTMELMNQLRISVWQVSADIVNKISEFDQKVRALRGLADTLNYPEAQRLLTDFETQTREAIRKYTDRKKLVDTWILRHNART